MRRAAPLLLVLVAAGCGGGGGSTTARPATATQPSVAKPLVARLAGGTAQLRRAKSTQTAVTLLLPKVPKNASAELDKGSCRGKLQLAKPLGRVTSRRQSWSVLAPLSELTAAPLAVVIRGANHRVVACGQVPAQGR